MASAEFETESPHLSFSVDPYSHKTCVFTAQGAWVLCVSDPSRVLIHFAKLLGRESIIWVHQELNEQPLYGTAHQSCRGGWGQMLI